MNMINKNIESLYEIKKSKFISLIYIVNNIEDVNNILNSIRDKYRDATHICYAYRINSNIEKCSDDGEPSGTAGIPILSLLKKKNITNVLAIVVRYFGGIKLGAGGLVRAYTTSVNEAFDKVNIIELEYGKKVSITINYDEVKDLDYILKDKEIISKEFNDKIKYIVLLKDKDIDLIRKYNYEIIENYIVTK